MSSATCWDVLGLEPGADRGAIRKAYAKRLKAIDPEADPQSFIALREAMDSALGWTAWQQMVASADVAVDTLPALVPVEQEAPVHAGSWEPAPEIGPAGGASTYDSDALDTLDRLLFEGKSDQHPDPRVLAAAVRRILDDPAMHSVDHADWMEHWLAEAIAEAIPRSDPIVPMVSEHFGWNRQQAQWSGSAAIEAVAERHKGLALLDQLAMPDHPYHRAYLSLTSSDSSLGMNALFERRQVKKLLETIRAKAPEAEGGLDPYRVGLWEDRIYGSSEGYRSVHEAADSGSPYWRWIIAALLVIKALAVIAVGE